jgi:cell division protein FtsW
MLQKTRTLPPELIRSQPATRIYRPLSIQRERGLLGVAALFVGVTHLSYLLLREQEITHLWRFGVWLLCVGGGHWALNRTLPTRDPLLYPVMMLFSGWGLALIDRLAPPFAVRQTLWLVIAMIALIAVIQLPHHLRWLSRYRYLWLIGGLGLLITTILLGRNPAGDAPYLPRLWLGVFDAYFQPSELLKIVLIIFLASYLADHRDLLIAQGDSLIGWARYFAPLLSMWGVSVVILVWQRDLGTAALYLMVFLGLVYLATGQARYAFGGLALLGIAGVVAYFAYGLVRLRVDVWWNPWPEADDRAFQIVQSLIAFAAGGVFGQGIGQGSPTYIPVVHSDFVFAAIGEEWGLIGTLSVIASAALLTTRSFRLAAREEGRPFQSLLAAGIGLTYATQSLLILGGTLKVIPLTGVTLPFLSYGGSSLVINFLMFGLLFIISGSSKRAVGVENE